jgi:uncharacterized membrane-anchored protein
MDKVLKKINDYLDALLASLVALSVAGVLSVENIKALVAGIVAVIATRFVKGKAFPTVEEFIVIAKEEEAEVVAKPVRKKAAVKKPVL